MSWQRIASRVTTNRGRPAHRRSIGRLIALLRSWGLLGVVATGRRGCFAPGGHLSRRYVRDIPDFNAAGDPSNEVAVYVLTQPLTPREKADRRAPAAPEQGSSDRAVDENDTPTPQGLLSSPARARETRTQTQIEPLRGPDRWKAAQARRRDYVLQHRPGHWFPTGDTPGGKDAALRAAHELRVRIPIARCLSSEHVRSILRPFFDAGWTLGDVLIALDIRPGDQRWPHDGDRSVDNPGAWLKYRLAAWTTDGEPRRSPSQRVRQRGAELAAERRAETERAARTRSSTPEFVRNLLASIGIGSGPHGSSR